MMKTALAHYMLLLLLGNTLLFFICPVKADSTDFIRFDSGATIFSPLNMTYYYRNLVLNLSLYGAGNLGGVDPQISMNFSIDGLYNGSVPLKSDGEIHILTRAIGTVDLPELPEGSHYLTIYLYGLNQRAHEPRYLSYINTVYFSTVGTSPVLGPTISPTSTPEPTQQSEPFSTALVIAASVTVIVVAAAGLLVYLKKRKS